MINSYSFNFTTDKEIYIQTGFSNLHDARDGLHNVANLFCNNKGDKGNGKITRHGPDISFLVEEFDYVVKRKSLQILDKLPELHKD